MNSFQIDPDKWVNINDVKLEEDKLYWFKKSNGKIVMGTPFTSDYGSGIANVYLSNVFTLLIDTTTFHILKNSQVQEVQMLQNL
jgi:hypothetical protein